MSNDSIKVTGLMPIYNGAKYLEESIQSILNQDYRNFELIIIDDASTDNSLEIINSFQDNRIKVYSNNENIGLVGTLNRGISLADGKYLFRMDQDDISHKKRISEQVEFLENNPEVGICGTWVKTFGENVKSTIWKYPKENNNIISTLLFNSPLAHPSVMFRLSTLNDFNLRYNSEYKHTEDFAFWVEAMKYTKFANIPKCLLNYRVHIYDKNNKYKIEQSERGNQIRKEVLIKFVSEPTNDELSIHNAIATYNYVEILKSLKSTEKWLNKLMYANEKVNYFPKKEFHELINKKWVEICIYNRKFGLLIKSLFGKNSFSFIDMLISAIKIVYRYIVK